MVEFCFMSVRNGDFDKICVLILALAPTTAETGGKGGRTLALLASWRCLS